MSKSDLVQRVLSLLAEGAPIPLSETMNPPAWIKSRGEPSDPSFKAGDRIADPAQRVEPEPVATPDAAHNLFAPASNPVRTGPTTTDQDEAIKCFQTMVGHNPTAPPVRLEPHVVGTWMELKSPLFGLFRAQVLADTGTDLWVFHPNLKRETTVPASWIVGAVDGPDGETLSVEGRQDDALA